MIARVPGEAFDADQITPRCEECGLSEYVCCCSIEPPAAACETCEGALTHNGFCFACDDFGLTTVERIAPNGLAA